MTNFAGRICRHARTRTIFTAGLKLFTVFIVWLSLLSTAQAWAPKKTPRGQSQTFNFSLSSAGDQSVYAGSSVMDTITGSLLSGSTKQISFSVAGLPSGATGSFSQIACNLNCSSVLTVGTTAATSGGTFPITVTATGGGVTKTTPFFLTVLTVTTLTNSPSTTTTTTTTSTTSTTSSGTTSTLALASSPSPTGNVYYVAKTGSDSNSCIQAQSQSTPKLTIAAGISCLSSGDTLNIRGGTYNEAFYTSQFTSLSGSSWNTATTIQGYSGETVNTNGVSFCAGSSGTTVRYIIFKNLHLNGGGGSGTNSAATISACGNPGTIDHIRFDTVEFYNAGSSSSVVFLGNGGQGNFSEILNSMVHDNGNSTTNQYHGIYVAGSNMLVEHTEIYNISGLGIQNYEPTYLPSNNVFRYNYIHDTGTTSQSTTFAILLANGSNNQAYGNVVYNNAEGVTCRGNSCVIYNNTIVANGTRYRAPSCCYSALKIDSGFQNGVLKNNIVYMNAIDNILDNGTGSAVSNNLTTNPQFVDPANANFSLQPTSPAIGAGTPNIAPGVTVTGTSYIAPGITVPSTSYTGVTAPNIGAF